MVSQWPRPLSHVAGAKEYILCILLKKKPQHSRFLDMLDTLRERCPWDAKQANESLRPNTVEEVFELARNPRMAIDVPNIRKELGDVLLHVAFYSKNRIREAVRHC